MRHTYEPQTSLGGVRRYARSVEGRILGRVFTWRGHLHFVVGVDEMTGDARCNRRGVKGLDTVLIPLPEVVLRLQQEGTGVGAGRHVPPTR